MRQGGYRGCEDEHDACRVTSAMNVCMSAIGGGGCGSLFLAAKAARSRECAELTFDFDCRPTVEGRTADGEDSPSVISPSESDGDDGRDVVSPSWPYAGGDESDWEYEEDPDDGAEEEAEEDKEDPHDGEYSPCTHFCICWLNPMLMFP